MAKARLKTAPKPKPEVKPQPPQYAPDVPLKPLEKGQKIHKWMEPPDIGDAAGVRTPDASKKFVPSEHASKPHEVGGAVHVDPP